MESRESGFDTVDRSNPPPVDMVNTPKNCKVLYMPRGAGFLPATVLYRKYSFESEPYIIVFCIRCVLPFANDCRDRVSFSVGSSFDIASICILF